MHRTKLVDNVIKNKTNRIYLDNCTGFFICGCFLKTVYLPRLGGDGGRQEGLRSGFGCFIVPTTLTTILQKTAFP